MVEKLLFRIALTLIPNVGPIIAKSLVSYCGSVKSVFETPRRQLLKIPGIGESLVKSIYSKGILKAAEKELQAIQRMNICTFFYLDKNYPKRLKHFPDAPLMLYQKGQADLNFPRTISIIGTRRPTQRGIETCRELVRQLKAYNPMIISGLAYGIDITAHKTCLQENIPTLGIVGHGLSTIYPVQHHRYAVAMQQQGGILSEYPSNTLPDGRHFPMRNRIIAGLSDAVIVIETAEQGGSIITAEIANNYNKDVFAIPGSIYDSKSRGCNMLIKKHKATLIENGEDLGYFMNWNITERCQNIQKELFVELDEEEKNIVALLREKNDLDIDDICHLTQLKTSYLASILLNLEFKGVLKSLPGKRYILI